MNYLQIKQRLYDVLMDAGFEPAYGYVISISPVLDIAKVRAAVAEQLDDAEYVEMLDLFDNSQHLTRTPSGTWLDFLVAEWFHRQSKG